LVDKTLDGIAGCVFGIVIDDGDVPVEGGRLRGGGDARESTREKAGAIVRGDDDVEGQQPDSPATSLTSDSRGARRALSDLEAAEAQRGENGGREREGEGADIHPEMAMSGGSGDSQIDVDEAGGVVREEGAREREEEGEQAKEGGFHGRLSMETTL